MNLEELGITKDELLDRMAATLSEQLTDEQRREISKFVTDQCRAKILASIDLIVAEQSRVAFDTVFQPVNAWGEKQGEPTTIRDAFLKKTKEWWLQKVNREGKPDASYLAGGTMAAYHAKQVVGKLIDEQMKAELVPLMSQAKTQLAQAVLDSIADIVNRNFNLKK